VATPDEVLMVEALPNTRSGKIMRRILRNIAAGEYEDMGNITTLADPSVVEALIKAHKKLIGGK
jgi:acetyl-CoA synthetase